MEDGLKRMTTTPRAKSARPFVIRSKQWTLSVGRPELKRLQSAQRSNERYLALAQSQAQTGDVIGAENDFQHAGHYDTH